MKRYSCFLLFILLAGSFYSCSEDPVLNPPGGGDFNPTVTSPEHDCGDSEFEFILNGIPICSSSSFTLSWGGNEFSLTFSYRYKLTAAQWTGIEWSAWSAATEQTIDNLDEGAYIFEVKSRFEEGIESATSSIEFTIDAVPADGIRFYPLHTAVSASSQFTIDIYVEDPTDLMGAEIEFVYDDSQITYNSSSPGALLLSAPNQSLILEQPSTGTIRLTLTTLASQTSQDVALSTTGSLVQLTFTAKVSASGTHELDISESSIYFKESDPETPKSFTSYINATIVIQ